MITSSDLKLYRAIPFYTLLYQPEFGGHHCRVPVLPRDYRDFPGGRTATVLSDFVLAELWSDVAVQSAKRDAPHHRIALCLLIPN